VEGSISTNAWTTKDGEKKEYKEISCTIFKTFARANKDGAKDFNQPKTSVSESLNSVADDMPF
jgi:single-stranded DNA-binding protein